MFPIRIPIPWPSHGHVLNEPQDPSAIFHGDALFALEVLLQERRRHLVASATASRWGEW